MEYGVNDLFSDYTKGRNKSFLVSRLRHIQKNASVSDLIFLLDSKIIRDEKLFDQIFFNRICRKYEIVKYILTKNLDLTPKQIEWISQTKFIQNLESERDLFLKFYSLTDFRQKRLSVNKLAKKVRLENISINDNKIFRTMKIGIDYFSMDGNSKKWLDIYLKEYEEGKVEIYKDLYNLFKNDVGKLLAISSQPNRAQTYHQVEKIPYLINGEQAKILIGNNQEYPVYKIVYNQNDKLKEDYIAYVNGEDELPIKLKKDKDSDIFFISKFDSLRLGNYLSSKYFSLKLREDKAKDPFYFGIKFSDLTKTVKSTIVAEALRTSIGRTVCAFLDKYYESIFEAEKIFRQNKKIFEENNIIEDLSSVFEYPNDILKIEIEQIYKYNSFVGTYNQYINEHIWQVRDDIKDKVRKLNYVKGVPSFPIIEKERVKNYQNIFKDIIDTFERLKIQYENKNWSEIDPEKLGSWLTRKSVRSGRLIIAFFKKLRAKNTFKEIAHKQILIPKESSVEVMQDLISYVYERITKIKEIDFKNHLKVRDWADMYAQYISLVSELVFDKKSKEYEDFRIKFNTNTALLKADPFEEKTLVRNEIYFTGFSSKSDYIKKGFALAFKEVEGKIRFYLIFNLKNSITLKLTDTASEFKSITWEGSGKEQKPVVKYLNFKNEEGTCILPLAFGRRIGQRYFYNSSFYKSKFNQLNPILKGIVKFSDVRVIKETSNKKSEYFCAISLAKSFPLSEAKEYEYKSIVGVDMGEKIPAVIAAIDFEGKIKSFKYLHPEMNSRLVEIQVQKDKYQANKGYIPRKFSRKISNITKVLLEDIAISLIAECVSKHSLLVTEDLSRGFGRGSTKGTYVWMRQYTKLNDILFDKSKEFGLTNGNRPPLNYTSDGILAKVPAGYTSKTSIQTGFILRSPKFMEFEEDNIKELEKIVLWDKLLNVCFELDILNKCVNVKWNEMITNIKFNGKASELGRYYDLEIGKAKFDKLINIVFTETDKTSIERKTAIKSFIYNLINPRKKQEVYSDIFTKKSVNADVQGAVNIARSFLFGLSNYYKPGLGSEVRLKKWQEWYVKQKIDNIPEDIFIKK